MTPEQLADIQARADAATEGPWEIVAGSLHQPIIYSDSSGLDIAIMDNRDGVDSDAKFIANARTDVPALLALVREQQARLTTAKSDALREAAEHFKTRSDTFQKTMQEMADSREYGVDDIVRYGAYSAEANTTATWLRTRAALTAADQR